MTSQNSTLSKNDIKTFFISALGGGLEFYDFIIYIFFAQVIAKVFFDSSSQVASLLLSFSVFAAGYLARVFGGLVFSHFGDKRGRKKSFAITIFLMAMPTFLIGLLPTYAQVGITSTILLVACRIAQGLAFGGEIPCSIAFIYEHAHPTRRGLACGLLFCGVILGMFLGSMTGTLFHSFFSEQELYSWAWRIPFFIGGIVGFFGVYLRKYLMETPLFQEIKQETISFPTGYIFKHHKSQFLKTACALWVFSIGSTLFLNYLPTYFSLYHKFNQGKLLLTNSIAILICALLTVFFGAVVDKIGPQKVLYTGLFTFIFLCFPAFYFISPDNMISVYLCYAVGVVATSSLTAAGVYLLADVFPTQVRYSAAALSYNFGIGIFGGFTPWIATKLIQVTGWTSAPALYVVGVSLLALIMFSFRKGFASSC